GSVAEVPTLTDVSKANVANDFFQFSCMDFIVSPFVNEPGIAQPVQSMISTTAASAPNVRTKIDRIRGGRDHERVSKCTNRCTRFPRHELNPAMCSWPSNGVRVINAPISTKHSA